MRICIHRGSRQIGGNCVELESGGKHLLIDLGLPLDAKANTKDYLPTIDGFDGNDPSLLGILISHLHLDHSGLLAQISQTIPIGMGPAARRIMTAAAPFLRGGAPVPAPGWDFTSEQCFEIGPFSITPYLVDHSAYDAYALLIECGGKRLFYSGDLRAHGRKAKLFNMLIHHPPDTIDTLLLEGTSLGRLSDEEHFPTESDVEEELLQLFKAARGLALVYTSAQNIDRLVSIMRAAKRCGRRLVIDLYAAAILEATGNANIPQSDWPDVSLFIPESQRRKIKKNEWFDLLKRHSTNRIFIEDLREHAGKSVLLFRPLHCDDLELGGCLESAVYIYSMWEGYQSEERYGEVKKWLEKNDIPEHLIHTSGHASVPDLKKLVEALAPRRVVPMHTAYPARYTELFPDVELHPDNEWWEI